VAKRPRPEIRPRVVTDAQLAAKAKGFLAEIEKDSA
jgi:hypothetical protein